MKKKIISSLLVLSMMLSMLPMRVFAENELWIEEYDLQETLADYSEDASDSELSDDHVDDYSATEFSGNLLGDASYMTDEENPEGMETLEVFSDAEDDSCTMEDNDENADETETLEEFAGELMCGDFCYSLLEDGSAMLTAYSGDASIEVEIPESIDGYIVTALGEELFYYNDALENVIVPETVTEIGNAVFYHCEGLKAVLFLGSELRFGLSIFEGCHSLEKVFVQSGDDVGILCAAIVFDIGEERAKEVMIVERPDEASLRDAFASYLYAPSSTSLSDSTATDNIAPVSSTEAGMLEDNHEVFLAEIGEIYDAPRFLSGEEEAYDTGICGYDLTWAFYQNSGTLRIEGSGEMSDYNAESAPWYQYREQIEELVLPANLESIGSYAFYDCTSLGGQLVIPDSVTSIGDYAFYSCSKLTGLDLGGGVQSIGQYAFQSCSGMTGDLVIPDSVTSLGNYAFYYCSGFDGTLTLSENLTSIASYAFYNCSKLTGELVIPDEVATIYRSAFYNCRNLTSIVFGEALRQFDYSYDTFYNCYNITEITFKGLTVPSTNGYNIFSSMDSLETIYVPADSYDAYVSAYSRYVNQSVVFSTDFLNAKIPNFKVDGIYSQSVRLSWGAHTSERVVGYTVYRDGVAIGTSADCSFIDRGLVTGQSYVYTVDGFTAEGDRTAASTLSLTPTAPNVLDIRTDVTLNHVNDDHNTIYITVENRGNLQPLGDDRTVGMLYLRDEDERSLIGEGVLSSSLGSSAKSVFTVTWDVAALVDGDYELLFVLTDVDGGSDEYGEIVTLDRSLPVKIEGAIAVSDVSVIHLSWAIAKEITTNRYLIYKRAETDETFRLLAKIDNRSTISYTDSKVKKDHIYYYYIVGVNGFGLEGEPSDIVGATLSADTEAPMVTKLSPANMSYLSGTTTLQLTAQDNVSVTKAILAYSVEGSDSWTQIAELKSGNFSTTFDTTLLEDGVIRVKGIAFDAADNESDPLIYTYAVDNTGPEQVKGVAWQSTSVTATLSWEDVADNDISYFLVERKNSDGSYSPQSTAYHTLGVNIYGLTPGTEYIYRVIGYDIHGNRGVPSEDVVVYTDADTIKPVITQIRPTSGYYSKSISLSITAEDDYCVKEIEIQSSSDAIVWNRVTVKHYADVQVRRTLSYDLSLTNYDEGSLYIRALARDPAGNESVSDESAPFVQHMIDKTPPAAPTGIQATGSVGYIEIAWDQGNETDLDFYKLYRANTLNGNYTLIADSLRAINYFDRSAEDGVTYYYRLRVSDTAGNLSDFSDTATAMTIPDTEAPVIRSIYPQDGEILGVGFKTISILATDNRRLSRLKVEYSRDGILYETLKEQGNLSGYETTIAVDIPMDALQHGAAVIVRATAWDQAGNKGEPCTAAYSIDLLAPSILTTSASYVDDAVRIEWTGADETDLIGYRVYRKLSGLDSFSVVAQRAAVSGQTAYSCFDYNLPLEKTNIVYRVEAVDGCGNSSTADTDSLSLPDRSTPTPVINCEAEMECGVEYYFDASSSTDNSAIVSYVFDFGDGTTSTARKPVHTYIEVGRYEITLTVTDDDGNQASCTKFVTVRERGVLGKLKIRVEDENGAVIPNAPVYFDLGEEGQIIRATDSSGTVEFTGTVGKHVVGCVIPDNEWLPTKKVAIISAGEETTVTITLVHHVMIEGRFEIRRMSFDEIVAAGIDISKPENQYYVKVNVVIKYEASEVETSFAYNTVTGHSTARPIIYNSGGNGGGGGDRQIIPAVIWPSDTYEFSREPSVALLDIPVGVSSLKEFFDVYLHIINNASAEFSMLDNVVTLNVPDGLYLMDTYASQPHETVNIAEIKGQTTETIRWILRGDEIGTYYLSADYSGILSEFNELVTTKFIAEEPIEVYGLSNLKLTVAVADELDHGTFYYSTALTNEGIIDVYCPEVGTGDDLIESLLYNSSKTLLGDLNTDESLLGRLGITGSVTGSPTVMPPGYSLVRYYMNVEQTLYTEKKQKLLDYYYTAENSYGLQVEIVEKPLAYFKNHLNADVNVVEKADLTFTDNQSAYDYLMTNENYLYWNMFTSPQGEDLAIVTNGQEQIWSILKMIGGTGDFKNLAGADDQELIQALILQTLELSVEKDNSYSLYYYLLDWTKAVKEWAKNEGLPDTVNVAAGWVKKNADKFAEDKLEEIAEVIGNSLPRTFELIYTEYKWEMYKAAFEGYSLDMETFIIEKWEIEIQKYEYYSLEISETDRSQMLHELFSKDGAKKIWKAVGVGLDVAEKIVKACEQTSTDFALFVAAQSNITNINLFLDTLINYGGGFGDSEAVVMQARTIRRHANEMNLVGSLAEHLLDSAFWTGIKKLQKDAMKDVEISPEMMVAKIAIKIGVTIGDKVFNVSERFDIADNIRFLSHMSTSLQEGIIASRNAYFSDRSEENAARYMQLLLYLLKVRELGESQACNYGRSYEVLENVIENRDLFFAARRFLGAEGLTTWVELRDCSEDIISRLRVQLFRNPVATDLSAYETPIVTFDYTKGQTAQLFSSEYEYSLTNGATWILCDGRAVAPEQSDSIQTLLVRRTNANQGLSGSCIIYPALYLNNSTISVRQTKSGYRIESLDSSRQYEYSFDAEEYSRIPNGSYSYSFAAEASLSTVYIRTVADANHYASHPYRAPMYPLVNINVNLDGDGTVSGAGVYEYGEEAILTATAATGSIFEGWYEKDALLSQEYVLHVKAETQRVITAKFSKTASGYTLGDVNNDGKINVIDANIVRRFAAKLITIEESALIAADVNHDGKVNIIDANMIRRFAAKLISKFPA